jgi:DNA-binding LytR/AlgR family response regulator
MIQSKYKVLIVDDEQRSIEILKHFLSPKKEYQVIAEANNTTQALQAMKDYQPDLVFMDNKMPGKTGSDLIKELKYTETPNLPFFILYTAFREDVLETYGIEEAIGYLTKPLEPVKLDSELMNFEKLYQHKKSGKYLFLPAIKSSKKNTDESKRKILKTISPESIIYMQAQGSYSDVYITDVSVHKETVCYHLKKIENNLPKKDFFRIHGSFIINMNYFARIDPTTKMCILKSPANNEEIEIKISERIYKKFKDFIAGR